MKKGFLGILALTLIFGMAVIGCDDGDNNGENNGNGNGNVFLSKMNVSDATNLFIAPAYSIIGRSARNTSNANKLFKITEDGFIQEVTFTYEDEEGNLTTSTETLIPETIIVLNGNYLIISFGYNNNYLVNTNTEACYVYTNELPDPSNNDNSNSGLYSGEYISYDENGNIYFIADNGIKKISVSNINNVSISTVSAQNDIVNSFAVDKHGNIAYRATNSSGNNYLRYRKANGGYEILPSIWQSSFWTDFNGNLYFYEQSYHDGKQIKRIDPEPYSLIDYADMIPLGLEYNNIWGFHYLFKIKNKNKIIAINNYKGGNAAQGIYEVFNNDSDQFGFVGFNTFNLISINIATASENYYYLAGTSTGTPKIILVKVNPLDNSFSTLIDGDYDIYKLTVSNDDILTFNALQMSNGAIVVGQISSDGVVTVLDVTLDSELTVLERIR